LTAARATAENSCPLATHNIEKTGPAMRARNGLIVLLLLAAAPLARAQDPNYALTPAAAEKFVRATQQLVSSRAAPNVQGGVNPASLANVKAALDSNPSAQQALTAAGLTSAEYVSFMGAAITAMMVGQMEMAGVRGMLPPGVTARPSQPNIDFMKSNADLFARSMQPGASATANAGPAAARASATKRCRCRQTPVPSCRRRSWRGYRRSTRSSAARTARSAACRRRSRRK
jgi:hypothetical protein